MNLNNPASRVVQIHNIIDTDKVDCEIKELNSKVDRSPVRCINKAIETQMINVIDAAKQSGDSVGGIFEVIATGVPYGLGSFTQWTEKLQARISAMMMSINAFKGIEIGSYLSLYP